MTETACALCHRPQDVLISLDSELAQAALLSERASSNAQAGPSGRISAGHAPVAAVTAPLGSGGFEQPRSRDVLTALGALEAMLSPDKPHQYGAALAGG